LVKREDPYLDYIKAKTIKIDYAPLSYVKAGATIPDEKDINTLNGSVVKAQETIKAENTVAVVHVNPEQKADNKNSTIGTNNYTLEIKDYRKLQLTVIEGKFLNLGTVIVVTPLGVGEKKVRVGEEMVFGKEEESNVYNFPKEENMGTKQFIINYDPTNNNYNVKDFQKGTGIFIKIDTKHLLDQDYIISFCNTHILIYKSSRSDNILKFKFLQGSLKDKPFTFSPVEYPNVRVGRNKDLEVCYNDESISRIQCTFIFENKRWYLYDGSRERASTNGVWILASKSIEIKDNMVLKSGNTTFKAVLI